MELTMSKADHRISFNNRENESVSPNDTYIDLFGRNADFNTIRTKCTCKMFQQKFKAIFETGKENGLYDGETLVLISAFSNGKLLEDIPYGKLDDVKIFIKNNAMHFLSFVQPELHGFLIRTGYFRKNKYSQFSRNRTARIAKILDQLGKQRSPKSKYEKFTEIITKLK